MRYHLTPVRMEIIKNSTTTDAAEAVEKQERFYTVSGNVNQFNQVEDNVTIPKGLEPEISFDPAIPLLGIYPKEQKLFYFKVTCTHMFIVALFTIAKSWNQPKCPSMIDRIKKIGTYTLWNIMQQLEMMSLCRLQGHG